MSKNEKNYAPIRLVQVDPKYCNYLRQFDSKVPYNFGRKELRPFAKGILFSVDGLEYFAPLTSPKPKHLTMNNTIDFQKIDEGKLGAINFNNMIPVSANNYRFFDLNKVSSDKANNKRIKMMQEIFRWLNDNKSLIYTKASILYKNYQNQTLNSNVVKRCCNFKLLEKKCKEYNKLNKINKDLIDVSDRKKSLSSIITSLSKNEKNYLLDLINTSKFTNDKKRLLIDNLTNHKAKDINIVSMDNIEKYILSNPTPDKERIASYNGSIMLLSLSERSKILDCLFQDKESPDKIKSYIDYYTDFKCNELDKLSFNELRNITEKNLNIDLNYLNKLDLDNYEDLFINQDQVQDRVDQLD